MSQTVGDRLGPYEIIAPIGAGGMGEVYRAKDTRLGRDVALKILPPHLAVDRDRLARFHREARAVAALNHPNVVTLHSVEESDGVHFLTMELVDGQSLETVIPATGLAVERALEVAAAVADAIAAAHEKGLVHRDLKPANVMITRDGRVKVLDFGLAKEMQDLAPNEETVLSFDQTQEGVVMGTPAYMSPEQISGGTVDHRTDIFSIGLILYEMATGLRPFQGRTHAELAASILRDSPPALPGTDVPPAIATLIERCLAKRASERIQTAHSLASELRTINRPAKTAVRSAATPSLAVLPFANLSADKEQEYFSDGLAEEIITLLAQVPGLKVIARTSSFAFRGKAEDVRKIAEALDVTHVLDGQCAPCGTAYSSDGATDCGRGRRARVERALRSRIERYLRRAGRDLGGNHRRAASQAVRPGDSAAAVHAEAPGVRRVSHGEASSGESDAGVVGTGETVLRIGGRARSAICLGTRGAGILLGSPDELWPMPAT